MSKEIKTYFSEAMLKDKPKKKLGLIINDGAVTTPKIRDKAVTTEKVALEAITHKLLAEDSVNTNNIEDASVVSNKIMDNTIGGEKLKSGSIDKRHIAADAITEEKIAAGSISTDELQDGIVTYRKLALDVTRLITVLQDNLAKAVKAHDDIIAYAEELAKEAKENPHIEDITSHQIMNGAIDNSKLAVGAVHKEHIAADAVTEEKIAAGSVSTDEIQDGCVTLQKLAPDVLNKLIITVSKITIKNSIIFMTAFDGDYPQTDKGDTYAYNGQQLYKSILNGNNIEWVAVHAEANMIYIDEGTAQSYVADKNGNLMRMDKESTNIDYDVIEH